MKSNRRDFEIGSPLALELEVGGKAQWAYREGAEIVSLLLFFYCHRLVFYHSSDAPHQLRKDNEINGQFILNYKLKDFILILIPF